MKRRDFVKTGLAAPLAGPLISADMAKGTFVHCVYFWLNEGLTDDEVAAFEKGLASLAGIKDVRHGFFGAPAGTDRPIIDRSYSYALVAVFDDAAGHDAYQVDAVHDAFRNDLGHLWKEVKIYDFIVG